MFRLIPAGRSKVQAPWMAWMGERSRRGSGSGKACDILRQDVQQEAKDKAITAADTRGRKGIPMNTHIHPDTTSMGAAAAERIASILCTAVEEQGRATMVAATGASQLSMFKALVDLAVPWSQVRIIHMDEYVGLDSEHPAGFRRYLRERFVELLPEAPAEFRGLNGQADLEIELADLQDWLRREPVDLVQAGIGENGHLAFNDPPADFNTENDYLVLDLDPRCKQQQVGEGWFPELSAVPNQARPGRRPPRRRR